MSNTPQKFAFSKLSESQFESGHLRAYFQDRDLGIAAATDGLVYAVVHRASGPCPSGGDKRHIHKLDFQMNYVLKGTCTFEFEGEGNITFQAGDSWLQPPEIRHTLVDFSEDFEVLEIAMPANFKTENV